MSPTAAPAAPPAPFSLKNPYPARCVANVRLTGPESEKDTRHYVIALEKSGVTYLPGDALGLMPTNDPELAQAIVEVLGATGTESVPDRHKQPKPLLAALIEDYVITALDKKFIEAAVAQGVNDLAPLLAPENAEKLRALLYGHDEAYDPLDLLRAHPALKFAPEEFIALLRRLPPRLYSIASALSAHPNEVHLTVATVRYEIRGRARKGVASNFLAERWTGERTAGVYIQSQQKHFALPGDPATPIIMVGPGTGIAPFRSFVAHRRATGATGRNWLFFGERRSSQDFFYRDEFEPLIAEEFLRLSLAWSRDVPGQRTFVQTKLLEHAREVWQWIEEGAHFYVCGDKERMATDVDAALHRIAAEQGGRTPEEACEYVEALKKAHRYKRDVY